MARRILAALGWIAAAIAAAMLSLLAFVHSPWGEKRVAGVAERLVSARVDGDLYVRALAISPWGVRAREVLIVDHRGLPVIAARDVDVAIDPLALLAGRLHVTDLRIRGGRVEVSEDPALEDVGIGLAFQPEEPEPDRPRPPGPPPPLPPPAPLPIDLDLLRIEGAHFRLSALPGGPAEILVRDVSARVNGAWEEGARATVQVAGSVVLPVAAPVEVQIEASFADELLEAREVLVTLGRTRVRATGLGQMRALDGTVRIEAIAGAPEARAFGIPLGEDVDVAADFRLGRERLSAKFRARVPERGALEGEAHLDPRDGAVNAELAFASLDPRAWLAGFPVSGAISGDATATGDLPPTVRRAATLALRPGSLGGEPFGPGRLAARLDGDRVRIEEGKVAVAGTGLAVAGEAGPGHIDLAATADARNLRSTRRLLAALGVALPELGGTARLRAAARGAPERPELTLELESPRLRVGEVRAGELRLGGRGRVGPDGLPAFALEGRAAALGAGRFRGTDLRLDARREAGGAFELGVRSGGRYRLRAGGTAARERVVIERLRFRYPEGSLRLDRPVTIEPGDGAIAVRGLRLRGPGRIAGDLVLRRDRLFVDLAARDLRLDRLPQELVPEDLEGRIDLRARVEGRYRAPRGTVRFRLADGRYGSVEGLAASGDLRLAGGRAEGRFALRLRESGVVRGSFDLPLDPVGAPASAPLRLELAGSPLELAGLGRALGAQLPEGTLRLRVAGGGTLGAPELRLEAQALDVVLPGRLLPAADAALDLALADGLARVQAEGRITGRPVVRLEGTAPFAPRRFLADPRAEAAALLREPAVHVLGEARGLDLALLARWLGAGELAGPVAAAVEVRGPLVDPRGHLHVDVAARTPGAFGRIEGTVEADLGDRRTVLSGSFSLEGGSRSTFAASVDAPLTALLEGTAPPTTPVRLALDIPALRLRRVRAGAATARAAERAAGRPGGLLRPVPPPGEPGLGPRLAGVLEGRGRFEGTLERLHGSLRLIGRDLSLGDVPLGGIELSVRQEKGLEVRLDAIDPLAGTLTATARVGAEVSPGRLLREGVPALRALPAELAVDGTALSLAPLALVPGVAAASGRVAFEARAAGPLGTLVPRGRVAVDDGRVELASGQVLEGIELVAAIEEERVELRQLLVRAPGRGHVDATGELVAAAEGAALSLEAHARDFPVGGPGGVTARLTGEAEVTGTWAGLEEGLRAHVLLPRLRVEMPLRPPREVQAIGRHEDVVIVTGPEARRRIHQSRIQAEARALPILVEVEAPDVRVQGQDVDARLVADLSVAREPDGELVATGEIRSTRGTLRVLGRRFEVERAVARFDGSRDGPFLDATVRHEAGRATAWVDVIGPASNPEIRLRSEPPLPDSRIAVLIASGRLPDDGPAAPVGAPGPLGEQAPAAAGVAAGGAAASIAGSFLAGRLRSAIGPRLPLDVLALESGGEEGTRIEAGTYVGERLYLGYLRDLLPEEGENLNEIRAEYQLSRSFSLESFYGDAATGGVDLVYERSVPTGAQRTARREEAAEAAATPAIEPGRAPAAHPPAPSRPDRPGPGEPVPGLPPPASPGR